MEEFLRNLSDQLNRTKELLVMALILGRTMPMMVLTPFLAGKLAPTEVKMALGVLFAILLWPIARGAIDINDVPVMPLPFLMLMLKEVMIGFVIGFVNAHIFFAMEMAGRIIDTVRGSSMAEVMDPHTQQRQTPFGDVYSQLMLVIFVVIGGHHIFIEAFFYSFQSVPILKPFPSYETIGELATFIMKLTAEVILIAVILAMPVVAATLIADVVFGILNRVAPQLNAYFMSMPVKAMGGVIMVLVILEPFVTRLGDYVTFALRSVERTIELFML